MTSRFHFDYGDMALALILWFCTLPLIGLIVLPLLGMRAAAIAALALFLILMAVCWGICGWKQIQRVRSDSTDELY